MCRWKRVLLLFLGINLIAFSINLFLRAGFGSDPLTVLQEGMHFVLGITVGQASLVYNAIVLIVALLFAKKGLGMGTIAYILLLGVFIDGYGQLLNLLRLPELSVLVRILFFTVGQLAVSLGFALVIQVKLGTNGLDAILLTLEKKLPISYRVLRTIADVIFTLLGALMGGLMGLGSIISMLTTGVLVSMFRKMLSKEGDTT